MKRKNDWPEQLADTIQAAKEKDFVWGQHDCALFVCDCIEAMTGEDLAKDFRGQYKSSFGATKALIRNEGLGDLFALAAKKLGVESPGWLAKRGDVVGYLMDDEMILGIAMIGKGVFLLELKGIITIPLGSCEKSWRV